MGQENCILKLDVSLIVHHELTMY